MMKKWAIPLAAAAIAIVAVAGFAFALTDSGEMATMDHASRVTPLAVPIRAKIPAPRIALTRPATTSATSPSASRAASTAMTP